MAVCRLYLNKKEGMLPMNNQNCVAYMRYSTDNQTENSIEYQRAAIEKYCTQNGLTIQKNFIDEAYSATSDRAFSKW